LFKKNKNIQYSNDNQKKNKLLKTNYRFALQQLKEKTLNPKNVCRELFRPSTSFVLVYTAIFLNKLCFTNMFLKHDTQIRPIFGF